MNDTLAALMSSLASLLDGSMGWAILLLALAVRLALLPLTLHLSRRMLANQQKMKALQPEVDAIKARLKDDPRQMFAAVSALYGDTASRSSTVPACSARWCSGPCLACCIGRSARPAPAAGPSCG